MRYLEYHSGPHGFGMRLQPQSLPLATGIHVHLGLADIMRRFQKEEQKGAAGPRHSVQAQLDSWELREGWRQDIAKASGRYRQAVERRGFM